MDKIIRIFKKFQNSKYHLSKDDTSYYSVQNLTDAALFDVYQIQILDITRKNSSFYNL